MSRAEYGSRLGKGLLKLARAVEPLFPEAEPSRIPRSWIVLAYVSGFAVLAFVALARIPGIPAWNSVWAEDGTIFYQQALHASVPKALTTLWAGYSQLFPRLPAEVATLFPVKDLAPFMAVAGACSLSAVALVVFHASRGHLRSLYARAILVASMLLLPLAGWELLDNAVNIPWWLFFATFWLLLWRPRSVPGKVLAGVTCFLALSSDPLIGLFVPLAILRLAALRRISEHAVTAGFFGGIIFQAVLILHGHGQSLITSATFSQVPRGFVLQVGSAFLTGARATSHLIASAPLGGMALGAAVLVALTVFTVSSPNPRVRLLAITAVFFSVVMFAAPVSVRGIGPTLAVTGVGSYSRYDATPILLLVSAMLVRLDSFEALGNERKRQALTIGLLLLLPCWILDFRDVTPRSNGPSWSREIATATANCRGPIRTYLADLGLPPSSGAVTLKDSPRGTKFFVVRVACTQVERLPSLAANSSRPRVKVLEPRAGATVSGSTVLTASAPGVTSVSFWIFGGTFGYAGRVACEAATPDAHDWKCTWNTATVPNGSYVIRSEATNVAGHTFSPTTRVSVSNGAS